VLILTRNIGQSIFINEKEIQVTVLGVKGNQVKIGVEAPKSMAVHREEIHDRIQQEKTGTE